MLDTNVNLQGVILSRKQMSVRKLFGAFGECLHVVHVRKPVFKKTFRVLYDMVHLELCYIK
jgi:hypothetical protein